MQVIREETEGNRAIHNKLLLALDQEREKAIEVEDSMSMQVEALKKSNKEENHARVILQVSIIRYIFFAHKILIVFPTVFLLD